MARTLDAERQGIREKAKQEAFQEHAMKDADRDKLISDLRTQIGELKQKAEQGSQQSQGEVMEVKLEEMLRAEFPFDRIEPVPKGVGGADAVQYVRDGAGKECGVILWESKRTKNWVDGWLPKLRDDQRKLKADLAVLVSQEMPKGIETLGNRDGTWITAWGCVCGLAAALREGLIQLGAARRAGEGQQGKMELLYNYLSGAEFRQRVETIVEAFVTMQSDLASEKAAMERIWSRREKQLSRAISGASCMYGDLQGIIGSALPTVEILELPGPAASVGGGFGGQGGVGEA